jgi:6-phosphogluconolactonase (cycloisomerase 2 family)
MAQFRLFSAVTAALTLLPALGGCGSRTDMTCNTCGGGPSNFLEVLHAFPSDALLNACVTATIDPSTGQFSSVLPEGCPVLISTGMVAINGQFLYVSRTVTNGSQIFAYSISQKDGTLTPLPGSPFSFGPRLWFFALAAAPNIPFLFVVDVNQIDVLSVDTTTGIPTLVPNSPFAALGVEHLAIDPSGQFLYASEGDSPGGILAFTIGPTGALSPVSGSPFTIPGQTVSNSEPYGIVDTGKFVYAALYGSNQIAAFSVDAETGALSAVPGSPFPAQDLPAIIAVTGNFLYVISATDGSMSGYTIDPANGTLTPILGAPWGSQATYLAVDPSGQYIYVSASSSIGDWNIDPVSGALTQGMENFPYDGNGSLWLTIVRLPRPTVQ